MYRATLESLFEPPFLPTIVPRLLVLALLVVLGVLVAAAVRALSQERSRRRLSGAFWWRLVGAPLDAAEPAGLMVDALWRLVRGASNAPRPAPAEIGRRYVDLLTDNFGQPGFREVLLGRARSRLRAAISSARCSRPRRAAGSSCAATAPDRARPRSSISTAAERDLVVDFLMGAQRLPVASAPHFVQFPADSYWRGELHRVCDRPELAVRLVEESAVVGDRAGDSGRRRGARGRPARDAQPARRSARPDGRGRAVD